MTRREEIARTLWAGLLERSRHGGAHPTPFESASEYHKASLLAQADRLIETFPCLRDDEGDQE